LSERLFQGEIAEVQIWKKARSRDEIQANLHKRLTGGESDLLRYWPLDQINMTRSPYRVSDWANGHQGTVHEAIRVEDHTLPIARDALISAEYSTVGIDSDTQRQAVMMRRFFAVPALNGAMVFPEKRVEQLALKWIGNAQFAPTLLGYIEGAPPVPSENLTLENDYNGATAVELTQAEDIAYRWHRSQDAGLGATAQLFAGVDVESDAGILGFVETEVNSIRAGLSGSLDVNYSFQNESNITAAAGQRFSDRLELRGTQEQKPKFPHLGKRFIPKNIGYALVVSGLADVFITQLQRSGRMIGYQVLPVDGIPPDVNTITFLINPAYTINGSLDGLTGTQATSDRFFRHVPEMRSQYGSLYPASYYRLQEAYDLKQQIENEDTRRASYFAQFNSRLVDEASLSREIDGGQAPQEISLNRPEATALNEAEQQAQAEQLQREAEANVEARSRAVEEKEREIKAKIADTEKRTQALASFASWQRKMEDIQIRAGKRNIVNTYVWDGDGGLRSEAQTFASTVEHTIGGSFS